MWNVRPLPAVTCFPEMGSRNQYALTRLCYRVLIMPTYYSQVCRCSDSPSVTRLITRFVNVILYVWPPYLRIESDHYFHSNHATLNVLQVDYFHFQFLSDIAQSRSSSKPYTSPISLCTLCPTVLGPRL